MKQGHRTRVIFTGRGGSLANYLRVWNLIFRPWQLWSEGIEGMREAIMEDRQLNDALARNAR